MSGQVLELALVVDDRDEALREGHSCRCLAGMAADLQCPEPARAADVDRGGHRSARRGTVPRTAKAASAAAATDCRRSGRRIRELALEGAERTFVEGLARLGSIPVPVVGYETDGGIPIDFAWPDMHLAVASISTRTTSMNSSRSAGSGFRPIRPPLRPH